MDYRYFLAVIDSGSLAAAGERLHIAPSAVSRQVALLEGSIGVPLFERRPRGMEPTAAGNALAHHARRVLLEEQNLLSELRVGDYPGANVIRLVSTEGLSRYFLPHVLSQHYQQHPIFQYVLEVTSPQECVEKVMRGDADVGLTFSTEPTEGVEVLYSGRSPIRAVMRAGHPLSQHKQLPLRSLLSFPLALTPKGTTQRQLFDLVCQMESLKFNHVMTCNYSGAIHEFVRHSDTIAFGGAISQRVNHSDDLISIPLSNPRFADRAIQVLVMPRRSLPGSLQLFTDTLIEHLERVG
ncbi:LysR family transcriptional regulator [Pseudomonas sp. CCI3.2]|uniref:LysR family transcriptional regulator n=1 Tax=unclassified Pseudomonas TaxID=196821 RepID=UPI002AC9EABD|nr:MULTISPECIES: LysR family transcriptional regulator [unclassified Pseudomonas]MEB0078549.1 LysR family transcriptional regulator [Pseudomonas sp. MH10out]MEB0092151.1 LysR family transcriptional regulator [Pseudomonas sp. CCI4.2]MEB0100364.1 LysR family transcriptional regulator [Pseudomonas sp. CCI3.2]MEB0132821.1 LysR family transcriptional regulator [Pseudomonas sp. CCI2.4]MEB0159126.1 LysR family transcriptional regulator [Pseudomonas sp. AH2 (2023)]